MTRQTLDPERVRITSHAIRRYILRYPHDLLPVRPEKELRALLAVAQPMPPSKARRYRLTLARSVIFHAARWVFPLVPCNDPNYDWALPTVLRDARHGNYVGEWGAQRLRNWEMFRNGTADRLLLDLAAELRTVDLHELRREWHRRSYPCVLHGGYPNFDEFWRAKAKLLRCAVTDGAALETEVTT